MRITIRTVLTPVALAFVLGTAVQTFAQSSENPPQAQQQPRPDAQQPRPDAPAQPAQNVATAQGELTDVNAKASTLTVKTAASEMTFRYDDQTKVTGAQKVVAGLATMTGSQVTVQYRKDGQTNIATSIDVQARK
jgi:hypothetical protein